MGRAPCCDKANVKKGPWSPEEDAILKSYIQQHGTGGNWIALPHKIGLKRCGKSCRLRWLNYLRPNIRHGGFSEEEDNIICNLYVTIGSRWSVIAAQLPDRTDNDIKNYWNTKLKKKFLGLKHGKDRQQASSSRPNWKHEAKIESDESLNQLQPHYWPELPVPMPTMNSNQEPCFADQRSINNSSYGSDYCHNMIVGDTNNEFSSLNSFSGLNEPSPNLFGESLDRNVPFEIDELVYGINGSLQEVEGLEGMNMISTSESSDSKQSIANWGNVDSLLNNYSQIFADYETDYMQIMPQTSDYGDSSLYFEREIDYI